MQVLEDGQVVLVKLEGITPVKALPYDMARNSARADLLETMTEESLNKAASELRTELDKAPDAIEQFNAIASKAGAKTAAYGPFINPNILLNSIYSQNAKSPEEFQAIMDQAMSSRLAPPKELPGSPGSFRSLRSRQSRENGPAHRYGGRNPGWSSWSSANWKIRPNSRSRPRSSMHPFFPPRPGPC